MSVRSFNRFLAVAAAVVFSVLCGCSSPAPSSSSGPAGGSGGESPGGAGGAAGEGGAATTSSTSGTLTDLPCGSEGVDWHCDVTYPDHSLAFNAEEEPGVPLGPAVGEAPEGAAAGRVDVSKGVVAAVVVGLYFDALPGDLRVAVWQEGVCGLPTIQPPWQIADATASAKDVQGRWVVPLPEPLGLDEAGQTWVAVALSDPNVGVKTRRTPSPDDEPRFAWYGLADSDCDSQNDEGLSWTDIRRQTATGVVSADVDVELGVVLVQ